MSLGVVRGWTAIIFIGAGLSGVGPAAGELADRALPHLTIPSRQDTGQQTPERPPAAVDPPSDRPAQVPPDGAGGFVPPTGASPAARLRPGPDTPLPSAAFMAELGPLLRRRLADVLTDRIVALSSIPDAHPSDFELAVELAQRVTELDPDCVDCWRLLQQLADISDRRDLAAQAVERIVVLDPADEPARLRRLLLHVERGATAEERVAILQSMLAPNLVSTIGRPVASRLAMELALLLRRSGDLQGYATWLAEAVAIDPANPAATSELAGFLVSRMDDPVGITELLVARCLADPSNLLALEQLCDFLLSRGAYAGARRLLNLLVQAYGGPLSATPDLLTKLVVATWGSGDSDEALRLIEMRQRDEDETMRRKVDTLRRANDEGSVSPEFIENVLTGLSLSARMRLGELAEKGAITPETIQTITSPLWPELAAVRAAILQARGGQASAAASRELAASQLLFLAGQRISTSVSDEERLVDFAECAWWILFLGDDLPSARKALDETFALQTLPDEVSRRLNGWLALREGRAEEAEALLAESADQDPRSRLGQAILARARGDRRAAAAALLDSARRMAGSVEGVWAARTLMSELEAQAPLWPSTAEIEAQIEAMPRSHEQLLLDPDRALSFTIRLVHDALSPFERLEIVATIQNRSTISLALGPGGPIRPNIALPLDATTFGVEQSTRPLPMPMLIDIGRRLRIGAKEVVEVRCNLSRGPIRQGLALGRLVRELALGGTSVTLAGQGQLNPVVAIESGSAFKLRPGFLGVLTPPLLFRVDGLPFERTWRLAAIEGVKVVDQVSDVDAAGALIFRIGQVGEGDVAALPPASRSAFEESVQEQVEAVFQALPQLGGTGQAWVAALANPRSPFLEPLIQAFRLSDEPDVRLAVLAFLVQSPDDPILDETRRGDDPRLRRVAELVADGLRRDAAKRQ